jgi:hypothetical protein
MAPLEHLDAERSVREEIATRYARDQHAAASAGRALRDARSMFGDRSRQVQAARAVLDRANEQLQGTTRELRAASDRLTGSLRDRFADVAIDEFGAIGSSSPLVLLPVRLETRFALGGDVQELWIRIYPDEIHGDSHEPALTPEEVLAGTEYWETIWTDAGRDASAWKVLVERLSATRAAWVARTLTPMNVAADHEAEPPAFPVVPQRTDSWTRPVEALLLPDRWIAIGMRGGAEVARQAGRTILEPLALSADPGTPEADLIDLSGDGLFIDPGQRWTIDFEHAVECGMAIRLPLTAEDARAGFEQLLVVGVKGSMGETAGGAALAQLLDAHHYQRGLALLRQGTPTNNTEGAPSGFPPADTDALASLAVERDAARSIAGRDGERLARALGVPADTLRHVDRSDADEQAGARAMCGALWPATWGYFFEELLFEDEHDADVERFRDFFIEQVRARGPLPAFRVGSTPYGVVVTSSLTRWVQRNQRGLMQVTLPTELRRLREFWRRTEAGIAQVGRTADPDRDLLDVLEMDASAREVRVRTVLGPNASLNMGAFLGLNWNAALAGQLALAQDLAARFDNPGITSRVFALTYGKDRRAFGNGFVVAKPRPEAREPLSEAESLQPFNYIRWLRETASIEDVREERLPAGVAPPSTLLYLMLRHAMLREAARSADLLLVSEGVVTRAAIREVELTAASPATTATPAERAAALVLTPWQRVQQAVPAVTGAQRAIDFIWNGPIHVQNGRLRDYREYLRTLEDLPTAELERLFTETLDTCSHRLDAWVTAMFSDRLRGRRENDGTVVGGFGWVTELRPDPAVERRRRDVTGLDDILRRKLELARGAVLEEQVSTGGHIHTGSMAQAATAAILRNGYLSRRHVNGERYGVDLSSARVRAARWVLDAVRNGQPLGAVLGYQFERGLHEGHPGAELDKYVEPFRALYPLVGGQLTPAAPDEPVKAITARNVVHGWRLYEDFIAQPQKIVWGTAGLPAEGSTDFTTITAELGALNETVDAVSDLLLAESVYQLVRGNTAAASASLDTLSRGARPPDPEVIRSPRGGSTIIHRVALVLDPAAALPASWGGIAASPRSSAEPRLDAWLASVIGDPALVRCAVTHRTGPATVIGPIEVTLADLGIRALDALHIITSDAAGSTTDAAQPNTTAQASELDARIAGVVLGLAGADPHGEVSIDYAPTTRATRSFPEIAALLQAARDVLSTSRSLGPEDLVAGSQRALLATASVDTAELDARATSAQTALAGARSALAVALGMVTAAPVPVAERVALVSALRTVAAFGIPRAWVPSPHDEPDAAVDAARVSALLELATGVEAECTRRLSDATAAVDAQAVLDAVFGTAFRVTTRFVPAAVALAQPLAAGPTPTPTPAQVREWIRGAALVRAPLDRWQALGRLGRALGRGATSTTVTQLPLVPGAGWVALPFASPEDRPESATVGLAFMHDAPPPAATDTWTGLLLDEWTEVIPNREESTAVAFHYDDPGAEAPQVVVIAVVPDERETWSTDLVRDVLLETLEMARLRGVDRDLLGELEQLLPAIFVPANARNDTITTAIGKFVVADRAIVQRTTP